MPWRTFMGEIIQRVLPKGPEALPQRQPTQGIIHPLGYGERPNFTPEEIEEEQRKSGRRDAESGYTPSAPENPVYMEGYRAGQNEPAQKQAAA